MHSIAHGRTQARDAPEINVVAIERAAAPGREGDDDDFVKPVYRIPQDVLDRFLRLHQPADENWKTTHVLLEVTDGCPLNNLYRRFKSWIRCVPPPSHRPARPTAPRRAWV